MSSFSSRREQALVACEKVINGIEDGTITVSSSLLLCKKIARLVNDLEGQEWLGFEYGGYPPVEVNRIPHDIWDIGAKHGRKYLDKDKDGNTIECIFVELCGELEAAIDSNMKAIGNYTTQGFSVAGELSVLATDRMAQKVKEGTNGLLQTIRIEERRLAILKSQYYDYAVKWRIELLFGSTAKTVFEEYQERIDQFYSQLPTTTLQKLSAIEALLEDNNPERYAQVLISCRRLWAEVASILFDGVLPGYSERFFNTRMGKEIDVSGDHFNNKLSAVIETLQPKAAKNTLVGSDIIYLIDWIEQINNSQNSGVHHEVTREQAIKCIINTYIALGDILSLRAEAEKQNPSV